MACSRHPGEAASYFWGRPSLKLDWMKLDSSPHLTQTTPSLVNSTVLHHVLETRESSIICDYRCPKPPQTIPNHTTEPFKVAMNPVTTPSSLRSLAATCIPAKFNPWPAETVLQMWMEHCNPWKIPFDPVKCHMDVAILNI